MSHFADFQHDVNQLTAELDNDHNDGRADDLDNYVVQYLHDHGHHDLAAALNNLVVDLHVGPPNNDVHWPRPVDAG